VLSIGRILLVQLGVGGVLVVPLWLWRGQAAALAWLLGSVLCVVPNAFVAGVLAVRRRDARAALRALYWAEAGKFVLSIVLFAAVFKHVPTAHPALLLGGFIAAVFVSPFALIWGYKSSS
jgi:ATP synthase protein I